MPRRLHILLLIAISVALSACSSGGGASATSTPAPRPTPGTRTAPSPAATTAASAISIDEPRAGASVRVPLVISGAANVFEAVLFVQVTGVDGRALCERRVQATSGTGTPGTWATIMAFPPPASPAPVTIRAFSRSPRDGSEENAVTRSVQVSAEPPAIIIAEPRCNTDIAQGSTLTVNGTARVFEATLMVELRDAAGVVVKTALVTADAGAPDTGHWSTTLDLATVVAGAYELVAYSTSARDGSPENIFAIPVRITV
ncbi:MAG: hypothetical protein HY874_08960 [Chloroflexi bacterium]|nr:hypothetical protein [Chloroflexota bacterium]